MGILGSITKGAKFAVHAPGGVMATFSGPEYARRVMAHHADEEPDIVRRTALLNAGNVLSIVYDPEVPDSTAMRVQLGAARTACRAAMKEATPLDPPAAASLGGAVLALRAEIIELNEPSDRHTS